MIVHIQYLQHIYVVGFKYFFILILTPNPGEMIQFD